MTYVDGMIAPVSTARKAEYLAHVRRFAAVAAAYGALEAVDCWGDDVPEGKLTSMRLAVKLEPDETVAFSWVVWPSKAARDAGWKAAMADPRMDPTANPMPFDGKRLIFGGFERLDTPAAAPTPRLRTCLWFDGDGEAAARFYVTLLPDSRIETASHPTPGAPALVVEFTLAGAPYMILNGGPQYRHTPAASISVLAADQAEIDRLWSALLAGGGQEGRCGWLVDRFGVSWQIVPDALPRLMSADDKAAAGRARAAMMTMGKLDIAALEAAFAGD